MMRLKCLRGFIFSTKKQIRLQKKLEEEKIYNSIQSLDSVVDQEEYSEDQLKEFIQQRVSHTQQISKENTIPRNAMIAVTLMALPMIALPGSLFFMPQSHLAPSLFIAAFKYAGIGLCFQSGIHWGVAMSLHEQQLDSVDSSRQARTQFILGTLPMFVTMYVMNQVGCGCNVLEGIESIGVLSLYVLVLDIMANQQQQLPMWWLRVKAFYLAASMSGLGALWYLWYTREENLKQKENYYRRTIKKE